jgi:hypothetical protein
MFAVELEGRGEILANGVAKVDGDCTFRLQIPPPALGPRAFSFEFLDFQSSAAPRITFGVERYRRFPEPSQDYFDFLGGIRGCASRCWHPVSWDCLGTCVHLLCDQSSRGLTAYCEDYRKEWPISFDFDGQVRHYFLEIQQSGRCDVFVPSGAETRDSAFWPSLRAAFWSPLLQPNEIRGFEIQGLSGVHFVYTDRRLDTYPGASLRAYFEVTVKSQMDGEANECGLFVGFVSEPHQASEEPPGKTKKSIGFSSRPPTFNIAGKSFSLSNVEVGPGTTIGVGVDGDDCDMLTLNGRLLEIEANADKPRFNALVGMIATSSLREEVLVNMGQLPFKFQGLQPPPGWEEPCRPRGEAFEKGPPAESHLLHFFPFFGTTDDVTRQDDGLVASRPFKSHGRYEVTLLVKPASSLICLGLSGGDFRIGGHVGWERRCIGVHSDDGGLYREAGSPPRHHYRPITSPRG